MPRLENFSLSSFLAQARLERISEEDEECLIQTIKQSFLSVSTFIFFRFLFFSVSFVLSDTVNLMWISLLEDEGEKNEKNRRKKTNKPCTNKDNYFVIKMEIAQENRACKLLNKERREIAWNLWSRKENLIKIYNAGRNKRHQV